MKYSIYSFKRDGKYKFYVVFYDDFSNRHRRYTGVSYDSKAKKSIQAKARKEAESKAEEIIKSFLKDLYGETNHDSSGNMILNTFLNRHYFDYLKTNRTPATLTRSRIALKYFIRICGNRPLLKYKYYDIERYKTQRHINEGISKTTVDIELRTIKTVFMKAVKWDFLQRSPFLGESMLFKDKIQRRALTREELERLFEAVEGTIGEYIFKLTYYTGMRKGEITNLKWGLVNFQNRSIHLPGSITKSHKSRDIPLSKKAIEILHKFEELLEEKKETFPSHYANIPKDDCYVLQKQRGWGQYMDRSIGDVFRKARAKAGLTNDLKFHCLRHSTATLSLEAGSQMHEVSKILGHSTIAVTQKFYDHTTALNYRSAVEVL